MLRQKATGKCEKRTGQAIFLVTILVVQAINSLSIVADDSRFQSQQRLEAAIQAYQNALQLEDKGQRVAAFQNVEVAFSSILMDLPVKESGFSAEAYCNWGNAALQANGTGVAVLAFRRALVLDPSHKQSLTNLEFANSLLPEWTRRKQARPSLTQRLFFWRDWIGIARLRLVSACFFVVGCLLLSVSLITRTGWIRSVSLIPMLLWIFLSLATVEIGSERISIVFLADETSCRTADSLNSPLSFNAPIPAGTEGVVLEDREGWLKVELGERKQGWVPVSTAKPIK